MSSKIVVTWIIGGFFLLVGTWIITNLKFELGISELSYLVALLIAFVFYLIAGLAWINVAGAMKHGKM